MIRIHGFIHYYSKFVFPSLSGFSQFNFDQQIISSFRYFDIPNGETLVNILRVFAEQINSDFYSVEKCFRGLMTFYYDGFLLACHVGKFFSIFAITDCKIQFLDN